MEKRRGSDANIMESSTTEGVLSLEPKPLRPFKTKDEYLYAMKEDLAEWFNCLYEGLTLDPDNFFKMLETGVLLCRHANNVRQTALDYRNTHIKDTASSHLRIPHSDVSYRHQVKAKSFQARDNISNFITWTRELGIMDCLLFETDDLVLRKNENSVILCLLEVARKGAKFGMLAPVLVQMEEEIDKEIAGEEIIEPVVIHQRINTNEFMSLDEMVRAALSECSCPSQFPMVREGEGKYRIGGSKTLVFVRILRNHVMVRVGGGWDTLENYLDRHDPCRCQSFGHRIRTQQENQQNIAKTSRPLNPQLSIFNPRKTRHHSLANLSISNTDLSKVQTVSSLNKRFKSTENISARTTKSKTFQHSTTNDLKKQETKQATINPDSRRRSSSEQTPPVLRKQIVPNVKKRSQSVGMIMIPSTMKTSKAPTPALIISRDGSGRHHFSRNNSLDNNDDDSIKTSTKNQSPKECHQTANSATGPVDPSYNATLEGLKTWTYSDQNTIAIGKAFQSAIQTAKGKVLSAVHDAQTKVCSRSNKSNEVDQRSMVVQRNVSGKHVVKRSTESIPNGTSKTLGTMKHSKSSHELGRNDKHVNPVSSNAPKTKDISKTLVNGFNEPLSEGRRGSSSCLITVNRPSTPELKVAFGRSYSPRYDNKSRIESPRSERTSPQQNESRSVGSTPRNSTDSETRSTAPRMTSSASLGLKKKTIV